MKLLRERKNNWSLNWRGIINKWINKRTTKIKGSMLWDTWSTNLPSKERIRKYKKDKINNEKPTKWKRKDLRCSRS